MPKGEGKLVAQNKKARHDYTIIDTIEAGIVLQGTEIKSIRNRRINLQDGFARISLFIQCSHQSIRARKYF